MSVYAIACLVALGDKRAVRLRTWGLILLATVLGAVACAGFSNKGSSPGTLLALDAQTVYRVQTSWVSEDADADGVVNGADNCPAWPNPTQALPPWSIPANDPDCDGFSTTVENSAGTGPTSHCGVDAWPADINNDGFVDVIGDISRMTGQFGNSVPPAPARYDIAPDPPDHFIDVIGDIVRLTGLFGQRCS